MLRDLKHMLERRGFKEGSNTSTPKGDFVIEARVRRAVDRRREGCCAGQRRL